MIDMELAKKIAMDFNKTIRERVDMLLKEDCNNYTNLGLDSTEQERKEVREVSRELYHIINAIDEETGELLITSLDS